MPVEINGKTYYRTIEVCRRTQLSRATVFRWLRQGIIEASYRDRRGWKLFSTDDLSRVQAEANRIVPVEKSRPTDRPRKDAGNGPGTRGRKRRTGQAGHEG